MEVRGSNVFPASRKYFLIYCMNFDYCLQTKEKTKIKQHSAVINNFYLLVLDYLEYWLNLVTVCREFPSDESKNEIRFKKNQA